ncbi:MAG: hypothetical protein ACFFD2_18840 [Promethearchaeota archaeon]
METVFWEEIGNQLDNYSLGEPVWEPIILGTVWGPIGDCFLGDRFFGDRLGTDRGLIFKKRSGPNWDAKFLGNRSGVNLEKGNRFGNQLNQGPFGDRSKTVFLGAVFSGTDRGPIGDRSLRKDREPIRQLFFRGTDLEQIWKWGTVLRTVYFGNRSWDRFLGDRLGTVFSGTVWGPFFKSRSEGDREQSLKGPDLGQFWEWGTVLGTIFLGANFGIFFGGYIND